MAKRNQPLKEYGVQRSTKKPKLDISINRGRCDILGSQRATTSSRSSPSCGIPAKCPSPTGGNNFWDDDDDDVILQATQVAEIQVATQKTDSILDCEMTFSEFAPQIHASTSTQRPPVPLIPDQDALSQMFGDDDDDDDDFMKLAVGLEDQRKPGTQQQWPERGHADDDDDEHIFKKPLVPPTEASGNCVGPSSESASGVAPTSSNQSEARRQLASERQIKFLMERVDALKKDNTKLAADLGETKSNMLVKEGETALLRDELRHMKLQIQSLKMEKIFSADAAKNECNTRIAELSKQIELKETALQMRSIEYTTLKMRHADESRRNHTLMRDISLSMRNESMVWTEAAGAAAGCGEQPHSAKKSLKMARSLMRLRRLSLTDELEPGTQHAGTSQAQISAMIFEIGAERGTAAQRQRRTLFQLELERLQNLLAKLQLLKQQQRDRLTDAQVDEFTDSSIESMCKVFPELWSYVHSLEYPKNCRIYPYHEYNAGRVDSVETGRQSVHQPGELHEEERAITLRRYVAALAVVCQQLPASYTARLLAHRHGEYALLQIAIDAITQLGYSREVCEHFGLLEAFATLLHSLLLKVAADAETELLVGMLKQLVFTRPSPWIFREITDCMLACVRLPHALSLLCVNSSDGTFVSDRVRSLYRFSNESCLLQVYAGLLEIAFPLHTPLPGRRFDLLTVICRNHVRFLYYCFAKPPRFIHNLLPSFDDEDGDVDREISAQTHTACNSSAFSATASGMAAAGDLTGASSSSSTTTTTTMTMTMTTTTTVAAVPDGTITCECYTKLCLSVVTLLFQVLCEWLRRDRSAAIRARVSEISKISVQLLHIIFCDNYITRLFRDAEETTKHYLCLICKWWAENAELLQFNDIQLNFLRKLQASHVMPKPLAEEGHTANIAKDLSEWYRLSNDTGGPTALDGRALDATAALEQLRLMDAAADPDKFFEGLNGYAFNFQ